MSRIDEIFEMADAPGVVAVRVKYPDGEKVYLTEAGKEPPKTTAVLYGDDEEKVFLLFRYPELYSKFVEEWVKKKLMEDEEWRKRYWENPDLVRSELRHQFKDQLYAEAKAILKVQMPGKPETKVVTVKEAEPEAKPVYKSRTVVGNAIVAIIVALLAKAGVHVSPEQVAAVFAILNWFFRAITKQPVR